MPTLVVGIECIITTSPQDVQKGGGSGMAETRREEGAAWPRPEGRRERHGRDQKGGGSGMAET